MAAYGALTFASALLLFLVQPLLAKAILPWFGGAASVWTTCLLFYQTLLFAGYAYAHLGRRLGLRRQAVLHAALMAASVLLLPVLPDPSWRTPSPAAPALRVLALLTVTVGGPYVLLAGTTPLVQAWFAERHPRGSPYRLYAISNAGSLLALAAYPVAVEPLMRVRAQGVAWSWGYGLLAAAMVALAWALRRRPGTAAAGSAAGLDEDRGDARASRPTRADHAFWLACAAGGSALLMSMTNTMTMDLASVPLLWIVPLALYLLTYVLAFAGTYRRSTFGAFLVLGLAGAAVLWAGGFALPAPAQIAVASAVLFAGCMVCHGELAKAAPAPGYLTGYYLTLAAGGALGGLLAALVAPAVLTDFFEMPASVLAALALLIVAMQRDPESVVAGPGGRVVAATLALVGAGATLFFSTPAVRNAEGTLAAEQDFYGVLRVQDRPEGVLRDMRVLRHGRIFHGAQPLAAERRMEPTAYFVAGSGVERALSASRTRTGGAPLRIGVIGLGVGTLAAWTEPGDTLRFYELDPAVERLARGYFTYLSDARGRVVVTIGDGRLALERDVAAAGGPLYDVLVVDAFAGDAVPVHLLTLECLDLYRRALSPVGVLVAQITNRHVDLERVVRALAAARGMDAVRVDREAGAGPGEVASSWMVLAAAGVPLPAEVRAGATPPSGPPVLWTDDFSDILTVMRAR